MSVSAPSRFYLTTLGCKLNFAESSALVNAFIAKGWRQTRAAAEADLIVVHSCAVTAVAEKKTRQIISKLIKTAPNARFAVTGCMADVNSEVLKSLLAGTNHLIVKHSQKMKLPELVSEVIVSNDTIESFVSAYSLEQRTRSFLKIQDGCDYFCSYCTVPYARGRSVSNTISGVMSDVEQIISKGFREIILTGVNIGTFGLNNNESFFQLLRTMDSNLSGIRIRLGSTEPELLSPEIIDLVAQSKIIMPHFHLPLQSGCDLTLKRMHRRYDTRLFRDRVNAIKNMIPHACVAADVIAGFPGETADEFTTTYDFIKSLEISYLHVFPYSDRPLANASKSPDQVHPHEIRHRVNQLLELGKEKQQSFFKKNTGTIRPMLAEGTSKNGLRFGFTDNYIKCGVDENSINENAVISVILSKINEDLDFVYADSTT
ncbi:Threonylcarbamoyladenosine tRNA methylthiotransferase MtaB [bioreactor metagenome]|uniref:Threonylcarbamoyladenosine tRNA methylthiotransferase MtaB n=1 Tax=bioreactor metagenome TaxID=1076179 RepID=A0A644WPN2_9ZZZZ